jgi:endonuclease/exonuclease/phosphatase family metal-dependent hydrolase
MDNNLAAIDQLRHELHEYFPALAALGSTPAALASEVYARARPEVERILATVAQENFAPPAPPAHEHIRAVAWNIERGARFQGIVKTLKEHPELKDADVLLLTELDYGMARSDNRCVPRELAQELDMNYAFATCYINLAKGNGWDVRVAGENTYALHGNAILSRWPLQNAQLIRLPNGKDKMKGTEKRLGSQAAVAADIAHPSGTFRAASVHLDAHSSQKFRHDQMKMVLDHIDTMRPAALPTLIGGDWNTATYDSSRAWRSILGFGRRCAVGVSHMLKHHYLEPERWFERGLFRELTRRGYDYRSLNQPQTGTLHYDMKDIAANTNMRDWVPNWCFWFINRALEPHDGICSLKLDWFTGRGITPAQPPRTIGNLRDADGPLSDHDAIALGFTC